MRCERRQNILSGNPNGGEGASMGRDIQFHYCDRRTMWKYRRANGIGISLARLALWHAPLAQLDFHRLK